MYEAVIGLEVHVHLNTHTKAFCGCTTEFGKDPNTQVCPVCLGFPGSLPVLNETALYYARKVGLALNCQVQGYTKFDRKHYYYPDLPKNFQISQYDLPVALSGEITIYTQSGHKTIRVKRVHLEEDAGKLIHKENESLVDFNRAGIALLEIVSEPDMNSPEEAYEYLRTLKSIVEYLDVSDCDMEKGSLRCDANVSIRKKGQATLGVKTEVKNMNSFKGVKDALAYEIERQKEMLACGEVITQETRLWDAKESKTLSMRTKEEAKDYRYFPEPDLPAFEITKEEINEIRQGIPELPQQKAKRFMDEFGLSEYDAGILVYAKQDAQYAQDCLTAYKGGNKKIIANWLIGPLLAEANARGLTLSRLMIKPLDLVELVSFVEKDLISNLTAKSVLKEMADTHKPAGQIIQEKSLIQISDEGELLGHIEAVVREHAGSVEAYKSGKVNALMFLVGQVMKKTKGKANPKKVQEMLRDRLS